jgi:O-antigen ligase
MFASVQDLALMLKRCFLIGLLLSSALVDVLGNINAAGVISVNGLLTILITIGVAVFLLRRPKLAWRGFMRVWPLSALLFYSVLQCLWHPPSVQGFQNICLLWIFIGCVVLASIEEKNQLESTHVVRVLFWASAIAALVYGISILYDGLGTESLIGARSFALYALLALGLLLGRWAHGSRADFWLAAGLIVLIALSLSRTALAVGVFLFPLARLRHISFRDLRRIAIIGVIAASGLYFLVVSIDALRLRFLGNGSIADYLSGEASVDTSGRLAAWVLTLNSFSESPWLGKGPGTANDLNGMATLDRRGDSQWELAHPLNEYLRFLHDEGVLGLSLFLAGCVQLLAVCRKGYRQSVEASSPAASFYLGTFLALLAVLLTMLTDNTASYIYVMAPLGILIGTVLRAQKQSSPEMTTRQTRVSDAAQLTSPAALSPRSQT